MDKQRGLSIRCNLIQLQKGVCAVYSSFLCFYPNFAFVFKIYFFPKSIWLGLAFKRESDSLPFRRSVHLHEVVTDMLDVGEPTCYLFASFLLYFCSPTSLFPPAFGLMEYILVFHFEFSGDLGARPLSCIWLRGCSSDYNSSFIFTAVKMSCFLAGKNL